MAIHDIQFKENTHMHADFSKNLYPYITMKNGKKKAIKFDAYLFGILEGIKYKIDNKYHGFLILTGAVGSGKSTLAQGICGVYSEMTKQTFDIDKLVWTSEAFVSKTDAEDNFGEIILYDEAITGTTSRKMALTSQGESLKNALVTKRFKKHLYILLVDEIEEYSWKLIKMAQAWIDVKDLGGERGYFNIYTDKQKIKHAYLELKIKKKMPFLIPEHSGKFIDFTDMWFDSKEYDQKKLEQTRQSEEKKKTPKEIEDEVKFKAVGYLREKGITWEVLAKAFGWSRRQSCAMWYERMRRSKEESGTASQ